jgi:hypothetical protein
MKCNVSRDLLASYCDGLLEEETKREVEAHLTECEECRKLKESYTAELSAERTIPEEKENINPFKKLKRKIKRIKVRAVVAILAASLMILGAGVLTWGQVLKNNLPSWDSVLQTIEVRRAAKALINGDIEGFYKYLYIDHPFEFDTKIAFCPSGMSENSFPVSMYDSENIVDRHIIDMLKESYEKDVKGHDVRIQRVETGYIPLGNIKKLVTVVYIELDDDLIELEFHDKGSSKYSLYSEVIDSDDDPYNEIKMNDFEKDCSVIEWIIDDSDADIVLSKSFLLYSEYELTFPDDDKYVAEQDCKSKFFDMLSDIEDKGVEYGYCENGIVWYDAESQRFVKSWFVELKYGEKKAIIRFSAEYTSEGNFLMSDTIETINDGIPEDIINEFTVALDYIGK